MYVRSQVIKDEDINDEGEEEEADDYSDEEL